MERGACAPGAGPAGGGGRADSGLRNARGPPGPSLLLREGPWAPLSPCVRALGHVWPGVLDALARETGSSGASGQSLSVKGSPGLLSLYQTPERVLTLVCLDSCFRKGKRGLLGQSPWVSCKPSHQPPPNAHTKSPYAHSDPREHSHLYTFTLMHACAFKRVHTCMLKALH